MPDINQENNNDNDAPLDDDFFDMIAGDSTNLAASVGDFENREGPKEYELSEDPEGKGADDIPDLVELTPPDNKSEEKAAEKDISGGAEIPGKINATLEVLEERAKNGDPKAQNALGVVFETGGFGVEADIEKALEWYRKAAAQGNSRAQNSLGLFYKWGKGVEKDPKEAFKYFQEAAKQGDKEGVFNLGCAYYNGNGTEQDFTKAFNCFKRVQDKDMALYYLGYIYYYGKGNITKDQTKAVDIFKRSAGMGNKMAHYALGVAYFLGAGIKEDKGQARQHFKLAAEKGYDRAQIFLVKHASELN